MFFERVPIDPVYGSTISQIFDLYGLPPRGDVLAMVMKLSPNESFRNAFGAVGFGTDLVGLARTRNLKDPTLCLPIGYQVFFQGKKAIDLKGLRIGSSIQPPPTHGVSVRFYLIWDFPPLMGLTAFRCKHIRWVQTVKARNDPYHPFHPNPRNPEFVDSGGSENPAPGEPTRNWPWYDAGDPWYDKAKGTKEYGPIGLTDTPGRPLAKTAADAGEFQATTSAAVWTRSRVTLIHGFTWGFRVDDKTVEWLPYIRSAVPPEIAEQIRILKKGLGSTSWTDPMTKRSRVLQTGPDLEYRPPPAINAINE